MNRSFKLIRWFCIVGLGMLLGGCAGEEVFEEENLALHLDYELSAPASDLYPDSGGELTDGRLADLTYTHPGWQGHEEGLRRTVTFDLREKKSISRITANFLQGANYSIRVPLRMTVSVSDDGKRWGTLAVLRTDVSPDDELSKRQVFEWNGKEHGLPAGNGKYNMVYARYVRISFFVDGWTMLDEVEIWGTHGKRKSAGTVPPDSAETPDLQYMLSGEQTGGIRNLILFYNGQYPGDLGDWKKEQFVPYVGYVDEEQQAKDFLFDGGLFLGLWSKNQRSFAESDSPSNKEDWEWYLDKTFGEQGDAAQLNEAVREVAEQLGQPDHRMKVVVMIPYPASNQANFGDVDGDGQTENFAPSFRRPIQEANNDRMKAVQWYIGELTDRWKKGNYSHLELVGLYWLNESVNALEEQVVIRASELVHDLDLAFFWIPYFTARGIRSWERLGFDAVALQPNHFFDGTDASRIQRTAEIAQMTRIGLEIELDDRVFHDAAYRQKYIDYLNGGLDYGFDGEVFRAYYQDIRTLAKAAASSQPELREVYDWIYQFINGRYTKR